MIEFLQLMLAIFVVVPLLIVGGAYFLKWFVYVEDEKVVEGWIAKYCVTWRLLLYFTKNPMYDNKSQQNEVAGNMWSVAVFMTLAGFLYFGLKEEANILYGIIPWCVYWTVLILLMPLRAACLRQRAVIKKLKED